MVCINIERHDTEAYVDDSHAAIEIHAVDTNSGVVLDAEIDVFADTKSKVAGLRKVLLPQFIFLNFETALKDFFSLGTSDCDVDCDLLVSSDTKGSDCVARFACERG